MVVVIVFIIVIVVAIFDALLQMVSSQKLREKKLVDVQASFFEFLS